MAHDVFVSYSEKDKPVADAVVARLEQQGIRCWIAPRDITPGTSWGEAIVDAIEGSRVMVLVLSTHSNRSRQVIREVERAVAGDVVILPFRIEAIDPTGAMAYFLGTEHWLDALTPPVERHIERLGRTVAVLLSGEPVPREELDKPPAAVARSRRRRWLLVALAASAVILAGGALALALVLGGDQAEPSTIPPTAAPAATTSTTTSTTTTVPVSLEEVAGYQPLDLDPTDAFPPDAIYGIDLAGSTLVYANGIDGVTTASVGDPTEPRPMATYAAYDAREIAFDGDWIFVLLGEHQGRLMIFDTGGTNSAQMESTFGDLSHLFLADEHLYVTSHNYVGILDVTDPLHPTVVHEWEPPESTGNPATAFVADGVAYFGAGWGGLYLFDVTDPAAPVALSHWPSPDWVTGLTVADGTAYVALGSTGLAILDVGDPQHPELLGLAELPGFASRAVVAHGHAFVGWFGESGTLGGIAVVDVRDPAEPVLRDTYGRLQSIAGLEIIGDHLIVADEAQGLIVFEIRGHDS